MKSIVSMIAVAAAVATLGARAGDDDLLDALDSLTDDEPPSAPSASTTAESDAGEAVDSDDSTAGDAVGEESGEAADGEEGEEGSAPQKQQPKLFHLLPFCRSLEGQAEILIPGKQEWQPIEEGKYYPLGATYRTIGATTLLKIDFGPESSVSVAGEARFRTRRQELGERSRALELVDGTISVKLPNQIVNGSFSVCAPGFTVTNMVGESVFTYKTTGDGDEATVRCVTQKLTVVGPHFTAPAMRAANEIKIRTTQDHLMTGLYGSRGDVMIRLDQGIVANKDFGTGVITNEPKYLDWKLSPQTAVRIHRANIPHSKSGRQAVTVMTFDANGALHNRCAFADNMVEVNSGELGPTSKKEREELAKRAAEIAKQQEAAGKAAETRDAEVTEEEAEEE